MRGGGGGERQGKEERWRREEWETGERKNKG